MTDRERGGRASSIRCAQIAIPDPYLERQEGCLLGTAEMAEKVEERQRLRQSKLPTAGDITNQAPQFTRVEMHGRGQIRASHAGIGEVTFRSGFVKQ